MQIKQSIDTFTIEQIVPYFQPIYNLHNNHVLRFECLSRLINDEENIFLPSDFLHIIARSQSNAAVTQRMLELSSAYCVPRKMNWSINMFRSDLGDESLMRLIDNICSDEYAHLIGVEFGIDSIENDLHSLTNIIRKYKRLHVTIDGVKSTAHDLEAIVDSGVHAIKIRASVLENYAKNQEGLETLRRIQKLCQTNNCSLIADRIETKDLLDLALALNMNYGQGFYLSQPRARSIS